MTPSVAWREPATIVRPSTSRAFAKSDPRIDVWATTISPAASEKSTMKSSGRFPSVDWSTPVTAGPKCVPTDSVPIPIAHASPPRAEAETMKTATGSASAKWSSPATAVSAKIAPSSSRCLTGRAAWLRRSSGRPRS